MTDMERQLHGYRLTTAEIIYRLPELHKFLDFWNREIEGPIHSVKVAGTDIIKPPRTRVVKHSLTIH